MDHGDRKNVQVVDAPPYEDHHDHGDPEDIYGPYLAKVVVTEEAREEAAEPVRKTVIVIFKYEGVSLFLAEPKFAPEQIDAAAAEVEEGPDGGPKILAVKCHFADGADGPTWTGTEAGGPGSLGQEVDGPLEVDG